MKNTLRDGAFAWKLIAAIAKDADATTPVEEFKEAPHVGDPDDADDPALARQWGPALMHAVKQAHSGADTAEVASAIVATMPEEWKDKLRMVVRQDGQSRRGRRRCAAILRQYAGSVIAATRRHDLREKLKEEAKDELAQRNIRRALHGKPPLAAQRGVA